MGQGLKSDVRTECSTFTEMHQMDATVPRLHSIISSSRFVEKKKKTCSNNVVSNGSRSLNRSHFHVGNDCTSKFNLPSLWMPCFCDLSVPWSHKQVVNADRMVTDFRPTRVARK